MMKTKKWGLVLMAAVCMVFFVGCNNNVSASGNRGDRILVVVFNNTGQHSNSLSCGQNIPVSNEITVRNALINGGLINISVEVAELIAPNLRTKYNTNNFDTRHALLNFVGENGWRLLSYDCSRENVFVKSR